MSNIMKTKIELEFQQQWQALKEKAKAQEKPLLYGVITTGIYCRMGCPSPPPLKKNIRFFDSLDDAQSKGFRACKRCLPDSLLNDVNVLMIAKVCQYINHAHEIPTMKEISDHFYISSSHLSRLFKSILGLTPREYAESLRQNRLSQSLEEQDSVTRAIYQSGFGSVSRVYENYAELLGMSPSDFSKKGQSQKIQICIRACYLGFILIASTEKGICSITLGSSPQELLDMLCKKFSRAIIFEGTEEFQSWVDIVIRYVNEPETQIKNLPLDIQGTVFQRKVWKLLQTIPIGETRTYGELARILEKPRASQAVGQACGSNPIALVIPCHRVVNSRGTLSGYRWGVERKQKILQKEGRFE